MSRKESSKYTNTLFIVNKVGVAPALTPMSQPRMTNKGGDTFYYDVSLCLTFGNVTNAGTSKINAVKDKKKVEFALRTKIACDKNHINGITTMGTIISTVHGFIKDEYADFWAGMPPILDQFEEILWAESPVLDKFNFTIGSDDVARVWGCDSEGRAWAGAPDIIAVANNKLTLADLKTSVKPYSRKWPKDLEKGSQEWRDLLGGHLKFKKTCKQLAAYDIAITQTLGITVQQAAILVSTPVRTQIFKISRRYLDMLHEDWYAIVAEYYTQIENCNVYDPDLI